MMNKIYTAAVGINLGLTLWAAFHKDWTGVLISGLTTTVFVLILCLRHATGK